MCLAVDADTVVFDNELSPAQQYNLEKLLGRTAIDRTAVILDIFAQNAHTLEGRAQVELALLRYRLPRLRRGASARLSQQGGGIGTRQGPGETKLETDRRRLTRRISRLEQELRELRTNRQLQRREPLPQRPGQRHHRRLHQRGQVHAPQPPHLGRCAGRGPAVRHARPDHPAAVAARRRAGAAVGHGWLRPPAPARPGRGVQEHARGGGRGRPAGPPGRRQRRGSGRADRCRPHRAGRDRGRPRARAAGVQQGRRGCGGGAPPGEAAPGLGGDVGRHRRRDRRPAHGHLRSPARRGRRHRAAHPLRPRRRPRRGAPGGRGADDRP